MVPSNAQVYRIADGCSTIGCSVTLTFAGFAVNQPVLRAEVSVSVSQIGFNSAATFVSVRAVRDALASMHSLVRTERTSKRPAGARSMLHVGVDTRLVPAIIVVAVLDTQGCHGCSQLWDGCSDRE